MGSLRCYFRSPVEGYRAREEPPSCHRLGPLTYQLRRAFSLSAEEQTQAAGRNWSLGKPPPRSHSMLAQRTRLLPLFLLPRVVCLVIPRQRVLRARILYRSRRLERRRTLPHQVRAGLDSDRPRLRSRLVHSGLRSHSIKFRLLRDSV